MAQTVKKQDAPVIKSELINIMFQFLINFIACKYSTIIIAQKRTRKLGD